MSTRDEADRHFHENLARFGERTCGSHDLPSSVKGPCLEALQDSPGSGSSRMSGLKRPALLSTMAIAASLVIAVGLFQPNGATPTVEASVILEKLTEQIEADELLEITIESLKIEGVFVDAKLQVAIGGIAGDIRVTVKEDGDTLVEVDASIGLSEKGGWVLLRKLKVGDPQVGAILGAIFPDGTETLLMLPEDTVREAVRELADVDIDEIREAASGEIVRLIKELIAGEDETGVIVRRRRGGMVELSLELKGVESIEKLIRFAAKVYGEEIDEDIEGEIERGIARVESLLGAKLSILYDSDDEVVRSLSVTDLGEMEGTVSITLKSGDLDPDLLDAKRVSKPSTRTFDLRALMSFAEALEKATKKR